MERYLSPLSGNKTTIFLLAFSSFLAYSIATFKLAPLEIPTNIPSILGTILANLKASSSLQVSTLSTTSKFKVEGINPAPIPCILWLPFLFWLITGLDKGSTPITLTS